MDVGRLTKAKKEALSCDLAVGPAPRHRLAPRTVSADAMGRQPPALPPLRSTPSVLGSASHLRLGGGLNLERSTDLAQSGVAECSREARTSPRTKAAPQPAAVRFDPEVGPASVASSPDVLDEQLLAHREKYGKIAEERRMRALQSHRSSGRDLGAAAEGSASRVSGLAWRFSRRRRRISAAAAGSAPSRQSGSPSKRPTRKSLHFQTAAQCALAPHLASSRVPPFLFLICPVRHQQAHGTPSARLTARRRRRPIPTRAALFPPAGGATKNSPSRSSSKRSCK
jgi:hypothetical protein